MLMNESWVASAFDGTLMLYMVTPLSISTVPGSFDDFDEYLAICML